MITELGAFLYGHVWPNVLASAIWAAPAWLWARWHVHRLREQHDELQGAIAHLHEKTQAKARDTNRLVRILSDRLGIDPDTGEDRLPPPRFDP